MKTPFAFILLLISFQPLLSQTPAEKRSTLGAGGFSKTISLEGKQILLQESVGQKSVIGSAGSGGYRISQGFIQPLYGKMNSRSAKQLQATIYPNPFSNQVTVAFNEEITHELKVTLLDMVGNTLYVNIYPPGQQLNFTYSGLNQGIYLMRIYSGTKQLTAKILKK